jgi:hypothetical protein
MSLIKMTDILVSTSAFIVTLTYQGKEKALLEVSPVGKAGPDCRQAEQFYRIITSDSSTHNMRRKKEWLKGFLTGCNKRILEEFWDNAHWKTLEGLCLKVPYITCVLYDKTGNVVESAICLTYEVLWALQRIEEAFFAQSLVQKSQAASIGHARKERTVGKTMQPHKYFLHHRVPR